MFCMRHTAVVFARGGSQIPLKIKEISAVSFDTHRRLLFLRLRMAYYRLAAAFLTEATLRFFIRRFAGFAGAAATLRAAAFLRGAALRRVAFFLATFLRGAAFLFAAFFLLAINFPFFYG